MRGEGRQRVDDGHQSAAEDFEPLAHQDQVGVVGDVAARRTEVDDLAGVRAAIAIRVDVGHHVVPQLALVLRGPVEIDLVDGGIQLGDLCLGDRQAEFVLGFGQCDPQLPPRGVDSLFRPQPAHRRRRVARNQRIVVNLMTRGALTRHWGTFVLNCAVSNSVVTQ